jgi:transketolase
MDAKQLRDLGQQLRVDAVHAAAAAGSGHPTSSMSAADLMAVLLAEHLRYDFTMPGHPGNDRLIFSKGHASPLLYALFRAAGALEDDELLSFRSLGSRLEGHPTPRLPWVDVATGSLGLGLPAGVGMALAAARLEKSPYQVWVLCGDSELAEGSMWEAFEHAGYERLDNLTAIIDVNRLGQRGETRHGWDTAAYARRISAFGWHTIEIDGHDVEAIDAAYTGALGTHRHHPDRFFEFFIAEQQMAAAALGMQVHGWAPFAATFAAFWARAYDFIRMAAIGRANLKLIGSHAGVSIGPDGPSQMGLEDLAMLRAALVTDGVPV